MSLAPGSRLGVYDVVALIGTGGMGEVYRARDTRLARDVAIKVLPEVVSSDRERVARFEREARALAALNHPNIAAIYGVENGAASQPGQPPVQALILELVEGQTLADRLINGPLRPEDALTIADQIAAALDAAHEKGIIHRDLKPANVKITPDGVVKVLDFGLAKILADDSDDVPTMTGVMTGAAMILGTPAYMAPEQAQGRMVDKRADVWAFGVLLFEMLTGHRPFRGASVHDTLAAPLTTDPDWSRIPGPVQPVVVRCLERDPRRRLRDIGDFRLLIDAASATAAPVARPSKRWPMAMAVVVLSGIVLALLAKTWSEPRATTPAETVRLTTTLPPGVSVTRGPGIAASVAVSPDGRTLVVAGVGKDGQRLYRRTLDRLEATPLAGTDRGSSPFFSSDGAWVGFFADGRLKRVPADGGAAVDIVAFQGFPAGASWGPDDRIVYAYGAAAQLHVVDARGGTPELISGIKSGRYPDVLPDGKNLLFESAGWVHLFDRQTSRLTRLVEGSAPRFADGRVILSRGTTLLAANVDLSRHELTGPVVPVAEAVAVEAGTVGGMRHYAVSKSGALAYVPAADAYALVVVEAEADGKERLLSDGQRLIQNPQFSPDGRYVAVAMTRRDTEPLDLWIHDLKTETSNRLTLDGGRAPVWTFDGTTVTYSHPGQQRGIYSKRADNRTEAKQVLPLTAMHWLVGWTPDRTLAYGLMEGTPSSIMAHANGQSRRVVGPGSIWGGRLSQDGRWLAYYSLDSGIFEVYVTGFPDGGSRWLIGDGTDPAWDPRGNEIYYRSGTRLMAARIDSSAGIRVLSRRVVIEPFQPPQYDDYDVHPDGRTLVMVRPAGSTRGREAILIHDWFTELRRLTGPS